MKISIIGAGNVGGLTALRLAQEGLGEVFLVDIAPGVARGKVFDLEDARPLLKLNYNISGTQDIQDIKDSDIIVVTAGFARKPGMTREELLAKNAAVLKDVCLNIKKLSPKSIVIIVTNPLDLMTCLALKTTGFKQTKVFGMGVSLDSARFANIIAKELNVNVLDVNAWVIGTHGEGMLPLPRFTSIKGVFLEEFADQQRLDELVNRTVNRGKEIVELLGSGSAYFAPSAAITEIVRSIVKDEKRTIGVSVYLNGEYGIKDVCLGLPCRLGRNGIEEIIKFDLNQEEIQALLKVSQNLREQYGNGF